MKKVAGKTFSTPEEAGITLPSAADIAHVKRTLDKARPQHPPAAGSGSRYASWLVRAGAGLVDLVLIVAVLLFARLVEIPILAAWSPDFDPEIGGAAQWVETRKHALKTFGVINVALMTAAVVVNTVIVQGITGQSLGKRLLRICLIDQTSTRPIGLTRAFTRQVAHIADAVPCYLGYLWPLWDPQRQTFADKLTSSVVMSNVTSSPAPAQVTPTPTGQRPPPNPVPSEWKRSPGPSTTPVFTTPVSDTQQPTVAELAGILNTAETLTPHQRAPVTGDAGPPHAQSAQGANPQPAHLIDKPALPVSWTSTNRPLVPVAFVGVLLLIVGLIGVAITLNRGSDSSDGPPSAPQLSVDTILYSVSSVQGVTATGIAVNGSGAVYTSSRSFTTDAPAPHHHLGNMDGVAVDYDGAVYLEAGLDLWKVEATSPAVNGPTATGVDLSLGPKPDWKFSSAAREPMYRMASGLAMDCQIAARFGTVYKACPGGAFKVLPGSGYDGRTTALPFPVGENHPPAGIAVDNAGAVYVTIAEREGYLKSLRKGKVLKLAPGATQPVELPFDDLDGVGGIAVDGNGTVHVVDMGNRRILALSPGSDAAVTEASLPQTADNRFPTEIAVDYSGAVYVAVSNALTKSAVVHKLTAPAPGQPSGSPTRYAPTSASTPWSENQWIVDAFPGLLPATPGGRGYKGLTCEATMTYHFACNPERYDAAPSIRVDCHSQKRGPKNQWFDSEDKPRPGYRREEWQRTSGTGHFWIGHENYNGAPGGMLIVFDAMPRAACYLRAYWNNHTENDVKTLWWDSAPI